MTERVNEDVAVPKWVTAQDVIDTIRAAARGAEAKGGLNECSAGALSSWAEVIERERDRLEAERDKARADAERLAAALRASQGYIENICETHGFTMPKAYNAGITALAAHEEQGE